ncbi:MAG: VanW family protein [Thermomicrobiales bacterium]
MSTRQLEASLGRRRASAELRRPLIDLLPAAAVSRTWLRDHRTLRLLNRALIGLALVLLLGTLAIFGLRVSYAGQFYPAVSVAGMSVGGETKEQATRRLGSMTDEFNRSAVTFTYQDQVFNPTLGELGVTLDVDASVEKAYQIGREPDATNRLAAIRRAVQSEQTSPLLASIDRLTLDAWFDEVDAQLGLPPHNAEIRFSGTSIEIVPEVDGVLTDRELATRRILATVESLQPLAAPLPTISSIASVRTDDLADARASVEAALERPVKVAFEGQVWELAPADLGSFIVQRTDPQQSGANAVTMTLDTDALTSWLAQEYEPLINRTPVDAVVGWNQGPVAVVPSTNGIHLRPSTMAENVRDSFFGDHKTVQIPVNVLAPDVDSNNLAALGITTELSRGTSNYDGSTGERSTNISVGSSLLNGTLIPPGGTFSFNHSIGEITAEKGYVEAKVIVAERIDRDIGGGICQVSTTVFRAAVLAGLPIVEWWPHTYRIAYYERDGWGPGYDASILQPEGDPFGGGDFRFQNPTGSWMLVESWADGVNVVVKLYGADTGLDAQFSETELGKTIEPDEDLERVNDKLPAGTVEHTELPEEGVEVWFTRDVYDRNGTLIESRKFYTLFHSRGNVWQVSPDMKGKSPASTGQ